MAYYRKRGTRWRAEVERVGQRPVSKSFTTKAAAVTWATTLEAEILGGRRGVIVPRTVGQALKRYALEISPQKRGARWEQVRLTKLERELGCAGLLLEDLQAADLAAWRDRALAGKGPGRPQTRAGVERVVAPRPISGASVRREMALLRSVFEIARKEWGWLRANPLADVYRPPPGRARQRVYEPAEQLRLELALGYQRGQRTTTATQRIGAAFAWSIETGMRAGELLALSWGDVDAAARTARLVTSKNGDARLVPLKLAALAILEDLPAGEPDARIFALEARSLDVLFRRARDRAGILGATFHDARATFITRTAQAGKVKVMELALIVGHRDLKSLMVYYRPSASSIAPQLD
jgi:integrase